jgi:hypothetical protein
MDRDELTPAEKEAFEMLPTERKPSRILEERTVRALKDRRVIRSTPFFTASRVPWIAAGIAAALALFVSGVAVGQWTGSRQTANALAQVYNSPADMAAARVQSTGSEHRQALAAMVDATGSAELEDMRRAREVALAALWAAATEILRLDPADPATLRILQELERGGRGAEAGSGEETTNVVWF